MEECGWKSSRRAQQVIKFIEVKAALPPKSEQIVRTERVARALSSVPEAVTIIEIRNGRQVFENAGVQPLFLNQDRQSITPLRRACFRSGEVRVNPFDETDRKL